MQVNVLHLHVYLTYATSQYRMGKPTVVNTEEFMLVQVMQQLDRSLINREFSVLC